MQCVVIIIQLVSRDKNKNKNKKTLKRQMRCFPYGERFDAPRLQQVEQKVVGRQRNLGLIYMYLSTCMGWDQG
jgi:hypothetical protein